MSAEVCVAASPRGGEGALGDCSPNTLNPDSRSAFEAEGEEAEEEAFVEEEDPTELTRSSIAGRPFKLMLREERCLLKEAEVWSKMFLVEAGRLLLLSASEGQSTA